MKKNIRLLLPGNYYGRLIHFTITHGASKQWENKILTVLGYSSAGRRLPEPVESLRFNPQNHIN